MLVHDIRDPAAADCFRDVGRYTCRSRLCDVGGLREYELDLSLCRYFWCHFERFVVQLYHFVWTYDVCDKVLECVIPNDDRDYFQLALQTCEYVVILALFMNCVFGLWRGRAL